MSSKGLFISRNERGFSQASSVMPPEEVSDGVSSSSDQDEDDGEESSVSEDGYDEDKEPLPEHMAFDEAVSNCQTRALPLVQQLHDVLVNHQGDSDDLRVVSMRAREALEESEGPKKVIGLLGDTGTGKSSSINSLTGVLRLAKAVGAGESCTRVVTIYQHNLPGQDTYATPFAAEICYLDLKTCLELLRELLQDYNVYKFEKDEDWLPEQALEYEGLCKTAFDIFRQLFCDHVEFESQRAAIETLQQSYEDQNSIIGLFESWCRDHFSQFESRNGSAIRHFKALTVKSLHRQIGPFVAGDYGFDRPSFCALVEQVRIGVPKSKILRYISLADLPGTSDINTVRARIAHKFIQTCDGLICFDRMDRCITNPSVDRNLAIYGPAHGTNLVLVITHTDSGIGDEVARVLKDNGQSIGDYAGVGRQVKKMDTEIGSLRKRLNKDNTRTNKRLKTMSDEERGQLLALLMEKSEACKLLRSQQFEILVDARNSHVTRRMKEDKQRHMQDGAPLAVFCVSNTHYQSLKHSAPVDGLQLSAENTGIPALRSHLLQIAGSTLLRSIEERIGRATIFIRGISLWTENTPQRRQHGVLDIVTAPSKLWADWIDASVQKSNVVVETRMIEALQAGKDKSISGAIRFYEKLETWNASTRRAFFGKYGSHETKSQKSEIWNERFTEYQTTNILLPAWKQTTGDIQARLKTAVDMLEKELRKLPDELNNDPHAVSVRVTDWSMLINEYVRRIWGKFETRVEELAKEHRKIRIDATKDVPTGYFTIAMKPMYTECKTIKGVGATAAMMTGLQHKLAGNDGSSALLAVYDGLKKDLYDAVGHVARVLQSDVQHLLLGLIHQFEMISADRVETPEEAKVRRVLRPALVHAVPAIMSINEELDAIKRKYEDRKTDS